VLEPQELRGSSSSPLAVIGRENLGFLNSHDNWGGKTMVYDLQLAIGDICEDPTGLLVRVEDIDVYDYVHFSVIESSARGFDETESGEMSHVAFAYRFTKLGNMLLNRTAA
jgi:hypothetical protein